MAAINAFLKGERYKVRNFAFVPKIYFVNMNRLNVKKSDKKGSDVAIAENYLFDQTVRHTALFDFIRDKNWDAVTSFVDKKVDPLLTLSQVISFVF